MRPFVQSIPKITRRNRRRTPIKLTEKKLLVDIPREKVILMAAKVEFTYSNVLTRWWGIWKSNFQGPKEREKRMIDRPGEANSLARNIRLFPARFICPVTACQFPFARGTNISRSNGVFPGNEGQWSGSEKKRWLMYTLPIGNLRWLLIFSTAPTKSKFNL